MSGKAVSFVAFLSTLTITGRFYEIESQNKLFPLTTLLATQVHSGVVLRECEEVERFNYKSHRHGTDGFVLPAGLTACLPMSKYQDKQTSDIWFSPHPH